MAELLSICIPTFDRAPYLDELLGRLVLELESTPEAAELVRLYISDNASTDDTPAIIERVGRRWPLDYQRQKINVGADHNFDQLISRATGTYFWLIGDDELVEPGFLSHLLQVLKPASHHLVVFEPVMQDGQSAQFSEEKESLTFADYAAFVDHFRGKNPWALMAHSLVTTMVIKRSAYDLEASRRVLETTDRSYAHMYGLVEGLTRTPGSVLLELYPTVVVRTRRAQVRGVTSLEINRLWRRYYRWLGKRFGHPELIVYGRTHFGPRKWWRMQRHRIKKLFRKAAER